MHKNFLKQYYFIDKFEKNNIDKQSKNTGIIYRNYKKNYKINEIILLRDYCRKKGIKVFLSNNIKLCINLNLDGAYLPSFNLSYTHLSYKYRKNFLLLGSAHNLKEIKIKEKQKIEEIFISPLFKDNKNYLGLYKFNLLSNCSKRKIIALGGIAEENIRLINMSNAIGFAGISYFK